MDATTWILLASVGLIVLAIIIPKPGRGAAARRNRIDYLLDQAVRRREDDVT